MDKLQSLRIFGPLVRAEEGAAERMVYGVATTEAAVEDWPGESVVLTYEATQRAAEAWRRWGNIREMHAPRAVGVAREITARDETRDLFIGAYIADEAAWEKVRSGVYKGFSINADIARWEYSKETEMYRVLDYDIVEVSLVDRPHDPEAVITVFRAVQNSEGGTQMLEQVWRTLMGDAPLPSSADEVVDALVRAIRATQDGADAGPGEALAQVQRLNGQVAELNGQVTAQGQRLNDQVAELGGKVTALLERVAKLEAQPLPVPVAPMAPAEPTLEEKVGELSRAIQEKGLRPDAPEVQQLMRLYQTMRAGGK